MSHCILPMSCLLVPVSLNQWFLKQISVASQGTLGKVWRYFLIVTTGVCLGCLWHEVGGEMLLTLSPCTGQPPTTTELLNRKCQWCQSCETGLQ